MKKQPFFAFFVYISKLIWLALIPILRELFFRNSDYSYWKRFALFDIIIAVAILIFALIKWNFISYKIENDSLKIATGFIFKKTFSVNFVDVSSVRFSRNPFYRVFKSCDFFVRLSRNSYKKSPKDYDVKLIVSYKDYLYFCEKFTSCKFQLNDKIKEKNSKLILFSFFFSSIFKGIIYISIIYFQLTKIFDDEIKGYFRLQFDTFFERFSRQSNLSSPILLWLISLAVLGFIISILYNYLEIANFIVFPYKNHIFIKRGLLTKEKFLLCKDKISFTFMRQTLPMRIFKIASLGVGIIGFGNKFREMSVLFPIGKKCELYDKLTQIIPKYSCNAKKYIRGKSIFRYILSPIIITLCIIFAEIFLIINLNFLYEFIVYLAIFALIFSNYRILIGIFGFYFSGISLENDFVFLKSYHRFNFFTVKIPVENVVGYKISQSIFAKFNRTCDLTIYPFNDKKRGYKVKGISITSAKMIAKSALKEKRA